MAHDCRDGVVQYRNVRSRSRGLAAILVGTPHSQRRAHGSRTESAMAADTRVGRMDAASALTWTLVVPVNQRCRFIGEDLVYGGSLGMSWRLWRRRVSGRRCIILVSVNGLTKSTWLSRTMVCRRIGSAVGGSIRHGCEYRSRRSVRSLGESTRSVCVFEYLCYENISGNLYLSFVFMRVSCLRWRRM